MFTRLTEMKILAIDCYDFKFINFWVCSIGIMPLKRKLCTLDQWCGSVKAPPVKKSLQELASPRSTDSISNHKVGFRDAWTTGRSWLKYDGLNNTMMCSLCSKHRIKRQNGSQIFRPHFFNLARTLFSHHTLTSIRCHTMFSSTTHWEIWSNGRY